MTGRRLAVIGSGISGLTAGYILSRTDEVTLFEAGRRLGGHADTHLVGPVPVDTGFIVYNEPTYPLLTRLFAGLGVTTQPAEMSMSVRCAGCGLRYAGKRGPGGLAAGLRRGGGRFLRLLADVPRFHSAARRLLAGGTPRSGETPGSNTPGSSPGDLTFGEFLNHGGYSGYFQNHFALPLVAAVWSCPPGTALRYPARYLFAFLANHGMLSVLEAVGERYWDAYFTALDQHLAPGGRTGLQTISMPHGRMLATRRTYTWIQKYIFPGGLLPSLTAIENSLTSRTRLRITDRADFGPHYTETLRIWRDRFQASTSEVARLGFDEVFTRMWTFYLCYSEAGFRSGYLAVSQLTLARI